VTAAAVRQVAAAAGICRPEGDDSCGCSGPAGDDGSAAPGGCLNGGGLNGGGLNGGGDGLGSRPSLPLSVSDEEVNIKAHALAQFVALGGQQQYEQQQQQQQQPAGTEQAGAALNESSAVNGVGSSSPGVGQCTSGGDGSGLTAMVSGAVADAEAGVEAGGIEDLPSQQQQQQQQLVWDVGMKRALPGGLGVTTSAFLARCVDACGVGWLLGGLLVSGWFTALAAECAPPTHALLQPTY